MSKEVELYKFGVIFFTFIFLVIGVFFISANNDGVTAFAIKSTETTNEPITIYISVALGIIVIMAIVMRAFGRKKG